MSLSIAGALGVVFLLSELGLAAFKRADKGEARAADRGSLRLLWMIIGVSVYLAYDLAYRLPSLSFAASTGDAAGGGMTSVDHGAGPGLIVFLGLGLFAAGLALRWYSIVYLGRFFTVNVAIAKDHRLIDGGPYRFIRHPSYAGALLAFAGMGVCLSNWASLVTILVPTFLVFSRRMRIEEDALAQGLGDTYRDYMRRTKRLIPAVY